MVFSQHVLSVSWVLGTVPKVLGLDGILSVSLDL